MSKFIARLVVTLGLLYVGGAVAFAQFHYDEGKRPDLGGVLGDFHGWLTSFVTSTKNPEAPPPPPPPATPVAPPAAPVEPAPSADPEERELDRIEREVLPKARELGTKLRSMERGDGEEFERLRTEAMASLGDARTYLNGLLEKDSHHRRANTLYSQLQAIYRALKSL